MGWEVKKFFKNLFTEPDNQTFCPIRLVAIIGVFQYLGLTTAHYVQHAVFMPQDFAIGFGALLTGVGVALGVKKDTPKC